jgi:hypothetical protein
VPPSFGNAALVVTDRFVVAVTRVVRRSALPCNAGALRRSLLAVRSVSTTDVPRSVRRLLGPFPAVAAPVSTNHRVSLPTCVGYSSRSQPDIRDEGASLGWRSGHVKRRRMVAEQTGRVCRGEHRPDTLPVSTHSREGLRPKTSFPPAVERTGPFSACVRVEARAGAPGGRRAGAGRAPKAGYRC